MKLNVPLSPFGAAITPTLPTNRLPNDINDANQVVGYSFTANDANYLAFVWQNGQMTALPSLGVGQCEAKAINNAGQIVGLCRTAGYPIHAVLWEGGAITDLGGLSTNSTSVAYDINERGQIVGISDNRGALWEQGSLFDLGVIGEFNASSATSINARGFILGQSQTTENDVPNVLWRGNGHVITDLTPVVGLAAFANRIADDNRLIGYAIIGGAAHAGYWDHDTFFDLGTLPGAQYPFSEARDSNRNNQIVGRSVDASSITRAVVWTVTQ